MTEARPNWMGRYIFLSIFIHLLLATALGLKTHEAFLPREPIRVRMVEIPKPAKEVKPEEADILAPFSSRASGLSKPAEERSRLEGPKEALPLPRRGSRFSPPASERAESPPSFSSSPQSMASSPETLSRPLVIPSRERAVRPEVGNTPRMQVERRREVPEREVTAGEKRRQDVSLPKAEAKVVEGKEPLERAATRELERGKDLPLPRVEAKAEVKRKEPLAGAVAREIERGEVSPFPRAEMKEPSLLAAIPGGQSLSKPEGETPSPSRDLSPKPETQGKPEELGVPRPAKPLRPEGGLSSPRAEQAPNLEASARLKPSPERPLSPEELRKALNLVAPHPAKEMITESRTPSRPKTSISLGGEERGGQGSSLDLYSITEDIQDKVASVKEANSPEDEGKAISLDTTEWKYVSYMAHIKRKIELAWSYPAEAAEQGIYGKLLLKFVLKEDGSLLRIKLLNSSQYKVLDEEALSAVSKAAPFKPFPPYFKRKLLPITASFEYRISSYP